MDRDHEIEEPVSHCPEITDITGLYRGSVDQHRMELVLRVNEEYSFHHIHNAPDDVDIFPGESFHGVSFGTSEIISQRESCFVQFRPSSFLFVPNMFGPGKGPILFVPPMQIEGSGIERAIRYPWGGEPPRPDIILRLVIDSPREPLDT